MLIILGWREGKREKERERNYYMCCCRFFKRSGKEMRRMRRIYEKK